MISLVNKIINTYNLLIIDVYINELINNRTINKIINIKIINIIELLNKLIWILNKLYLPFQ